MSNFDFLLGYGCNNLSLAYRFALHPNKYTAQHISMLSNQTFGAIDAVVEKLDFERDPQNEIPELNRLIELFRREFNRLLRYIEAPDLAIFLED